MDKISLQTTVPEDFIGKRLDATLACIYPEYSRERLKSWIVSGEASINGKKWKPKDKVLGGEEIIINAEIEAQVAWKAEKLPLDIVYEDEDIIVVNKPMNLVVHPGAGNLDGTLVNALLHHCPDLEKLPRAGIVHRIDKDTTGLLVVAKNLTAHASIVNQLQNKTMHRVYEAVVNGLMVSGGTIDQPIGRHRHDRKKMTIDLEGKPAVTHYRVIEKFKDNTHLKVQLETGRTHQIRVHLSHKKFPLVGDKTYGRNKIPKNLSLEAREFIQKFSRQALHAKELGLEHPRTGEFMKWEVPLPEDMQELLKHLRVTNG